VRRARALPATAGEEDELEELLDDDFTSDEFESADGEEPSPEAMKAALNQKAAIENGYTVTSIANFLDWVDTIEEAIKLGVFDGPALKRIMLAGLARRDAVVGKPQPASPPPVDYTGTVLGELGWVINPVPYEARTIMHDGKRYAKDDMIGKVVRTDARSGQWYLRSLLVKIVSVGNAYMTVSMLENPQDKYPSSTELKKKGVVAGTQYKLAFNLVSHIFG